MNKRALAEEIFAAYRSGAAIGVAPTARAGSAEDALDLDAAYAVEGEFARLRAGRGRVPVGRKIGYANQALWQALNLDTLIWANMYDDTVHHAPEGKATFQLTRFHAPKIEPEVVVKLRRAPGPEVSGADAALEAIEWLAIGFEIVDCPYAGWQFKPADFVATWGFHTALVVGAPLAVDQAPVGALKEALASFTLRLLKNGAQVAEGSGKNCMGSPALCLAEVARAVARQPGARALEAGELLSTGSLTPAQSVAAGETWRVEVDGLPVSGLELRFTTGS